MHTTMWEERGEWLGGVAKLAHQNAPAGTSDGSAGGGLREVEGEGGEREEAEERGQSTLRDKLPYVIVRGVVTEYRIHEMNLKVCIIRQRLGVQ